MSNASRKLERIDPAVLAANPRCTLSAWLKYEPVVLAAYQRHPAPYIYRPTSMSPVSVCSKIRDAIRGKLAFDYPSEIDTPSLAIWYAEIIVKHDRENVYLGPEKAVTDALVGSATTADSIFSFDTLSFEEVSAFQLLLSGSRLIGPITVTHPPDVTLLPERPNVEMILKPNGTLILL